MYSPLPGTWENLIRSGAQRKTVVDVYADPSNSTVTLADVSIESFKVTVDRNSSIRRTASVKIVDLDLLEDLKSGVSSIEPYGSEISIRSGFVLPDGSEVLIPLGFFQIEDLQWSQDETSIDVSLFDRSQALQRTSFGIPLDASGKQAIDFIQDLVTEAYPWVSFVSEITREIQFPGGTTYQSGKLESIKAAAEALGGEFFFDADGVARIVPIPYLDQIVSPASYDWLVNTGSDGVMISYSKSISRKDIFNKIHVWGAPASGTTPQPYGFATDNNPSSPTRYGGPFGKADQKIERQELTTSAQCTFFAAAQLRNSVGLSHGLSVETLSNLALDAGDKILVVTPDGRQELHLVDSVTFDETGKSTMATRTQVTT